MKKIMVSILGILVVLAMAWWTIPTTKESFHQIGPFALGQSIIKGEIKGQLDKVVSQIQRENSANHLTITVWGYADFSGSKLRSDELSKERARKVADYLTARFSRAEIKWLGIGQHEIGRMVVIKVAPGSVFASVIAKDTFEQDWPNLRYLALAVATGLIVIGLLIIIGLRRSARAGSKENLGITFENGERFNIDCPWEIENGSKIIFCPIPDCQSNKFKDGGPYRSESYQEMRKHLKGHHKKSQGLNLFQTEGG